MYSVCAIGGELDAGSQQQLLYAQCGVVCQFASAREISGQKSLREFIPMVQNAIRFGQLKTYFNAYQECVGYVIWAFLTPDVEKQFIAGKVRPLNDWEFNDGTSAWILDMAVSSGSLPYVLEDLRDVVFRNQAHVTYFRVKRGRQLCKRMSRSSVSHFLSSRTK
jgi:hemolysin-activating ACP:hemolysin acyltransferase